MSYEEYEEVEDSFKIGVDDDEPLEPLDIPEEMTDPEEDPDDRYH